MRKRKLISRKEVDIIIRKFDIKISGTYSINQFCRLDVKGDVKISYTKLGRLPIKFGLINGVFDCSSANLSTLHGAPLYVSCDFKCNDNQLTSLANSPNFVGGTYYCSNNKLLNLKGCASVIDGDLLCRHNKMKSLHGYPVAIGGKFDCAYNLLTNLTGVPDNSSGEMNLVGNYLQNLKGLKNYRGVLHIDAAVASLQTTDFDYRHLTIKLVHFGATSLRFLPQEIVNNRKYLDIIFKYQNYCEIWTDEDKLDLPNFNILLEEIRDGLK